MRAELPGRWRAAVSTSVSVASLAAAVLVGPSQVALAVGSRPTGRAQPAPTSVAALRAEVDRTGERLAAATTAWERGEAQLGGLVQRKVLTGRGVQQVQAQVHAARLRVSALANSLYRNPVDPALNAVLAGNLAAVSDYLYLKRRLDQSNVDQRRDIALLTTQASKTQSLLLEQDAAASAAIRLQATLDDDLTRLQTDALASQLRLQAAVTELRRREQAAAVSVFGTADGGGAACSGSVPFDAINGFLPPSALCPLRAAPGQRLISPAASAFDAMSAAFSASLGTTLCVTDSYRDYAAQVDVFRRKPNLAATPGRSQHGWGRAVDLCGGVQQYGSPAYVWLKQNAGGFGFVHPDWAEPDGTKPEPWHWEFLG